MMVPIAEAQAAESGTRLKARWHVTEDGARQWAFDWFDSERNEACSFQRALDGVMRCLPPAWLGVGSIYYLDAGCTQAVVHGAATLCEGADKYAIRLLTGSCGQVAEQRIWNLGEVVEPSALYTLNGEGACNVDSGPEGVTYRRLGGEVPITAFVAAQEQIGP